MNCLPMQLLFKQQKITGRQNHFQSETKLNAFFSRIGLTNADGHKLFRKLEQERDGKKKHRGKEVYDVSIQN